MTSTNTPKPLRRIPKRRGEFMFDRGLCREHQVPELARAMRQGLSNITAARKAA